MRPRNLIKHKRKPLRMEIEGQGGESAQASHLKDQKIPFLKERMKVQQVYLARN